MKELSIEKKAQRYDKAIAHAKTLLKTIGNATLGNLVLKNEFENMFPELKESREDEMIRIIKEVILNSVPYKENILTKDTTITAEEAIAWLEKQGEQKLVVIPKFRVGDIIRWKKADSIEYTIKEICDKGYINTADGIMDISQTDIEFELVEQKPILDVEIPFGTDSEPTQEAITIPDGCYAIIEDNKVILRKGEKKSSWSEDDEANASYICAALDCYYRLRKDRNNTNGQEDLDKARNWLYNKLKSIIPQPTWKPSYVQMEVLLGEVTALTEGCDKQIVLESLYNDLKKLKD